MAKEYIDREAYCDNICMCNLKYCDKNRCPIWKAPVADVVEVKRGEWILLDECANEGVYCSVCQKKVYKINYANQKMYSKYCPNCGARMDGGI